MRTSIHTALFVALTAALVACNGGGGDDDDDTGGIDADISDVDADTDDPDADTGSTCSETCDGCCSGDTCLGGDATNACGLGGAACVDCGANRMCGDDGFCAVDPASRWQILAIDGTVPQTNEDGDPWDPFGGLPDPYLRVRVGGEEEPEVTGTSSTASDTLTPTWDDIVLEDVPARSIFDAFAVAAIDGDTDADDTIGSCGLLALESWFDGEAIEQTCGGAVMRFRIRPE